MIKYDLLRFLSIGKKNIKLIKYQICFLSISILQSKIDKKNK